MNVRIALHMIGAAAAAIMAGTVAFEGLSETMSVNIVQVAALIVIVINTYMAATTQGSARS